MQNLQHWGEKLAAFGSDISRRNALALQPHPEQAHKPPLRRMLGELGSPAEVWGEMLRRRRAGQAYARAAIPRPVMLLPGFGTRPSRMHHMARSLENAGHRVSDWGLGFNLGPTEERFDLLLSRIEAMARKEREPLALVGWSLGGIFAREAARHAPASICKVITMGTPFSGHRRANNAWRAYQWVTGHEVENAPVASDLAPKPPVPTIAIWSPRDGVVHPRSACGRAGERDRAIPVRCNHLSFASHPGVIVEVLRQLDVDE
ncbi:alpha/beta hydrolase [Novosphingobium sp. ZN18A2]|uniref:esterase/lipase family protein n=1 Tax=Novosphingobium sp. ZN18A2 TaxID=3079861 RepID=UPI0030D58A63